MNLDMFSRTIECIYAAASDPAEWGAALCSIEELTGSVGAVIDFIPCNAAAQPMTIAGRFTLEQCSEYAANYQGICRRIAYGMVHPEEAIHYDALVLGEDEMDRDPVYAWLASHGLRYYIGARLPKSERHAVYASLQRSPAQGHVQADDIRLFELVSGHLGKAIALANRLGTLEGHRRFTRDYLDRLPQALFALDSKGRLVLANRAGEAMLSAGRGFACTGGHLVARHPADRSTIDHLIASAARPHPTGGGGWTLLRSGDGTRSLAVFVTHFALPDEQLAGLQPSVLLMVSDPCQSPGLEPEALCQLYGLTAAEARTACAIANTDSAGGVGHSLGIAPEMLKSHLKAIFRKLDVHRRQDVVQIVTNLKVIAGSPPNGG